MIFVMVSQGLDLFISMYLSISVCFNQNILVLPYIYEVHTIGFQTFFVWALLVIVHT